MSRTEPVGIALVVDPFADEAALRRSAGLAWAFAVMLLFVALALTAELAAKQRELREIEEVIAELEARVSRWDAVTREIERRVEMPPAIVEVRR